MELFNHIKDTYGEMNVKMNLDLDLPQAIFMRKLLSIKGDTPVSKKAWEIYMNSDKPLKLRYYLQIKLPEEISKSCDEATSQMNEENKYMRQCFGDYHDVLKHIPPYETRIELYEKYLQDKTFDENIQENILEWFKPDMKSGSLNYQIKGIINRIIIDKYTIPNPLGLFGSTNFINPDQLKKNIIGYIKRFKDTESVEKLLNSIRDVYILGLV